MEYLEELLETQRLAPEIEDAIRARRAEIQSLLQPNWPSAPRFYYGGSFAKKTAIAAQFDLDVVIYFPAATAAAPRALYDTVEQRLRHAGHTVLRHNVALRLQYTPGWHIDVVPGRALDDTYLYADLWASESGATRQTSLKTHIALAREGDRDVIRLLKLWRCRNVVPIGSFLLELAAARSPRDLRANLDVRFRRVLETLAQMESIRLVDPANSANVLTNDLPWPRKRAIAEAANQALSAPAWPAIIW